MNAMARTLSMVTGDPQHASLHVQELRLDSRTVKPGDVFFAIAAESARCLQHVQEAVQAGASAIVSAQALPADILPAGVAAVCLPGLDAAGMGVLADQFYAQPSAAMTVIGITGTNGKTTCSHWIAEAWSRLAGPAGTLGTLGCTLYVRGGHDSAVAEQTGLTTADVLSNHRLLSLLRSNHAAAVTMEVSSHALEQSRVASIRFDTAVFTNLTQDHLDYHGDMTAYGEAKRKLFHMPGLRVAVINVDDNFGRQLATQMKPDVEVLTCSLKDRQADIGVERSDVTAQGLCAELRTPWGKGALQSRYPGGYNLLNALAVVGTLCSHGMELQAVLAVAGHLQSVPGRTQIVSGDTDEILVIVDYAHTPDALEKVLTAVRERCSGQLWCVFGCGGNRDRSKRPLMGEVASAFADQTVLTTDNPRHEDPAAIIHDILAGCGSNVTVEADRRAAIMHAVLQATAGDAIVIAGKGHETYQEIAGSRQPFSDMQVAQAALALRNAASQGVHT